MARPWQDRYRGKILQDLATISQDSLKDHGKILAQSWQDLTEFFERSWQDRGKILHRFCKNLQDFLKDHGKILATSCRILQRSYKSLQDLDKITARLWHDHG